MKRTPGLNAVSIIAVALLLTLASCGRKQAPPPPAPAEVTVARPLQREITDYQYFTGRMDAIETAEVRARVKGFLQRVLFKEGTEVKKDQLLYQIDPRTFEADLERAQAEVKQREAQLQLASTEVARVEALRGTVGAVTEELYSQRVATREAAKAALEQAKAAVLSSKLELSFTKIYAPISGRISRTLVTEGNLVGYNEPTLLTNIVRLDPIYVYFDVPERNFLNYQRLIREQRAASAEQEKVPFYAALETEEDFVHEGVINFRDNRIDVNTGTILLRGELPNSDGLFSPGLFARIRVPIGKPKQRLLVPDVAISTDQRGQYLLVVDKDNTVVYRPVQIGALMEGNIVITSGLNADDWVIINGLQRARPGSKVTPKRPREIESSTAPQSNAPA